MTSLTATQTQRDEADEEERDHAVGALAGSGRAGRVVVGEAVALRVAAVAGFVVVTTVALVVTASVFVTASVVVVGGVIVIVIVAGLHRPIAEASGFKGVAFVSTGGLNARVIFVVQGASALSGAGEGLLSDRGKLGILEGVHAAEDTIDVGGAFTALLEDARQEADAFRVDVIGDVVVGRFAAAIGGVRPWGTEVRLVALVVVGELAAVGVIRAFAIDRLPAAGGVEGDDLIFTILQNAGIVIKVTPCLDDTVKGGLPGGRDLTVSGRDAGIGAINVIIGASLQTRANLIAQLFLSHRLSRHPENRAENNASE